MSASVAGSRDDPGTTLPLFPLRTVLFPEGELELRIFEPRYLRMIRDCASEGSGFGVCLLVDGDEVGRPAMPATTGTDARIVDFFTRDDGLLGIRVEGGRRFDVATARVRDDGLLLGDVGWRAGDVVMPVPPEYGLLATLLERIHEHRGDPPGRIDRRRYDDAGWVAFRLAEAFPLENGERQRLLQIDDPLQRLAELMHYLPRFQRD